jgi:soluble lytic murein transglycosylase-like protein
MEPNRRSFPAAGFFAASLLLAFEADASRAAVLRIETRIPVLSPPAPGADAARPGRPDIHHHIAYAAKQHGVRPDLIRAVIEIESRFDPFALSGRGACGLMQLMPATARRFGVVDCHDVGQNIHAGTRLLKALLIRYDGDIPLSMAAYNAGEGAVARHRGIPPYKATRAYVRNVERILAAGPAPTAAGS